MGWWHTISYDGHTQISEIRLTHPKGMSQLEIGIRQKATGANYACY